MKSVQRSQFDEVRKKINFIFILSSITLLHVIYELTIYMSHVTTRDYSIITPMDEDSVSNDPKTDGMTNGVIRRKFLVNA